jgi:hypothetical protein
MAAKPFVAQPYEIFATPGHFEQFLQNVHVPPVLGIRYTCALTRKMLDSLA